MTRYILITDLYGDAWIAAIIETTPAVAQDLAQGLADRLNTTVGLDAV